MRASRTMARKLRSMQGQKKIKLHLELCRYLGSHVPWRYAVSSLETIKHRSWSKTTTHQSQHPCSVHAVSECRPPPPPPIYCKTNKTNTDVPTGTDSLQLHVHPLVFSLSALLTTQQLPTQRHLTVAGPYLGWIVLQYADRDPPPPFLSPPPLFS